jgi:hypothetical protein
MLTQNATRGHSPSVFELFFLGVGCQWEVVELMSVEGSGGANGDSLRICPMQDFGIIAKAVGEIDKCLILVYIFGQ